MATDTAEDRLVAALLPQAKIEYVKDAISAYTAVSQGKLDAFVYGKRTMEAAIQNGLKGVKLLDQTLGEGNKVAVGISPVTKIPALKEKLDAFIDEIRADGTLEDMILALQSGKTDAFLTNNAIAALAVNRNHDLALFPQELQDGSFGFAFAKDDPRRDVWQAAFAAIPQSRIEAAWNKWTGADESVKALSEQDWPGTNGTVRVAACDTLEPMSYAGENGAIQGFDIEMILAMAKKLDVRVEFTGMEFSAVLSSVQAGKAQIGAGSIIATAERKESVEFVEYYPAAFVLIVRGAQAEKETSFWDGLRSSFNKTFLRENRWELFADGVLTTLLITVLSILFGTALGFLVFMLCRNGNIVANGVTRFSMWLVQQTLMPALAQPDIQAVIEYSEAEESAVLTVRYNGPTLDVTAKGEELSLKVLQSAVSDMAYTWDENAERGNHVALRIRE